MASFARLRAVLELRIQNRPVRFAEALIRQIEKGTRRRIGRDQGRQSAFQTRHDLLPILRDRTLAVLQGRFGPHQERLNFGLGLADRFLVSVMGFVFGFVLDLPLLFHLLRLFVSPFPLIRPPAIAL